jgi:hypothetical protein
MFLFDLAGEYPFQLFRIISFGVDKDRGGLFILLGFDIAQIRVAVYLFGKERIISVDLRFFSPQSPDVEKLLADIFGKRDEKGHEQKGHTDDKPGVVFDGFGHSEVGKDKNCGEDDSLDDQSALMPKVITVGIDPFIGKKRDGDDIDRVESKIGDIGDRMDLKCIIEHITKMISKCHG